MAAGGKDMPHIEIGQIIKHNDIGSAASTHKA